MSIALYKKVIRSLLRNKSFQIFNILGLAVGILCLSYSTLYIIHETKVDRNNINYARIYRVIQTKGTSQLGSSPFVMKTLFDDLPEIEASARFIKSNIAIKKNNEFIEENNLKYVDPEIFKILSIPAIYGNIENFLLEPNSIVLTQSISEKYFGKTNPVGQTLTIRLNGKEYDLKVDGVVGDFPDYSSFQANMFTNFDMFSKRYNNRSYETDWIDWGFTTIILIKQSVDKNSFEKKFSDYFDNYSNYKSETRFALQPLSSIYFHSGHLSNNKFNEGNLNNMILLGSICLIIFIISFINFTLLSIARKYSNLKELAVIKVLGAKRWDYVKTISVEAIIIAFFTLIMANILLIFILPEINKLLNVNFIFNIKDSISFYITCFIITLTASVIAGLYIAIVLFRINPLTIFRNNAKSNLTRNPFIKALIISQLTAICILIGITFSFSMQLSKIFHYDMGYDSSNLMIINIGSQDKNFNYNVLLDAFRKYPDVVNATASDCYIHDLGRQTTTIEPKQGIDAIAVDYMYVEPDYFKTLKLKLISGRQFMSIDSNAVIINESLAKLFPSNPVGEKIHNKSIIGIVKDFHFRSFYDPITPLMIELFPTSINQILIRMGSPVSGKSISDVRNLISKNSPELNFTVYSYENDLEKIYPREVKLKALFRLFIILSFILVFSGLLGFSFYITQSKTKEICIRKVHGANTISILWLISKDFFPLVISSYIIALPFAYYVINKLLNQFIIKVPLDFVSYFVTFVCVCALVLLILVFRTVFFLRQNMVQYLKSE